MTEKELTEVIGASMILAGLAWQTYFGSMIGDIRKDAELQNLHGKLDLLWFYVGGTISTKLDGRVAAMPSDNYFRLMTDWEKFRHTYDTRIHRQELWIERIRKMLFLFGSGLVLLAKIN